MKSEIRRNKKVSRPITSKEQKEIRGGARSGVEPNHVIITMPYGTT